MLIDLISSANVIGFGSNCVASAQKRPEFLVDPSMETDSGQRAMSRCREGTKERRERRLRAEARVRLLLSRDAVRITSHRGGDGCRRAHTDASTHTAPVDEPPVTKDVAPALAASYVAPVPVPEHVASTVTLVTPYPVIEDVAPTPIASFNNTSVRDR